MDGKSRTRKPLPVKRYQSPRTEVRNEADNSLCRKSVGLHV